MGGILSLAMVELLAATQEGLREETVRGRAFWFTSRGRRGAREDREEDREDSEASETTLGVLVGSFGVIAQGTRLGVKVGVDVTGRERVIVGLRMVEVGASRWEAVMVVSLGFLAVVMAGLVLLVLMLVLLLLLPLPSARCPLLVVVGMATSRYRQEELGAWRSC